MKSLCSLTALLQKYLSISLSALHFVCLQLQLWKYQCSWCKSLGAFQFIDAMESLEDFHGKSLKYLLFDRLKFCRQNNGWIDLGRWTSQHDATLLLCATRQLKVWAKYLFVSVYGYFFWEGFKGKQHSKFESIEICIFFFANSKFAYNVLIFWLVWLVLGTVLTAVVSEDWRIRKYNKGYRLPCFCCWFMNTQLERVKLSAYVILCKVKTYEVSLPRIQVQTGDNKLGQ